MRNRVKALYILTVIVIMAFCGMEGWWLVQKYEGALDANAADMYLEIVKVADEMMNKQEYKSDDGNDSFLKTSTTIRNDSTKYSGFVVVHKRRESINSAAYANKISNMVETGQEHEDIVKVLKFNDINVENADVNAFIEALSRVRSNITKPFNPAIFKAAVDSALLCSCTVDTLRIDPGKVWKAKLALPKNIFKPVMKVTYPYNPLQGKAVEISTIIPVQSALSELMLTFSLSFIVAILLISCLLYQLTVIRQQRKVADLQQDYTLTMLHELKRPLASLKLALSFLRNPKFTDKDKANAMSNASREIDNLGAYFNKLRSITYNEASEMPLVLETFSLSAAIDDSISQLPDTSRISKLDAVDVTITAERQAIVNAISNLIENALKYSKGAIVVEWNFDKPFIEIKVSDKGPGIPDNDKKRIFDKFYRLDKNHTVPGMGLGLVYVKQIAEAHGGSIEVADNPDGGSIFNLQIPQS